MPTQAENPAVQEVVVRAVELVREVEVLVQQRAEVAVEEVRQQVLVPVAAVQQPVLAVAVVRQRVEVAALQRVEMVQAVAERKFLSMIVETFKKGYR